MTVWLGRLAISLGVNGRGDNGCNPPWLGFYHGCWFPWLYYNGGRLFRREVLDLNFRWLCFHGSFTFWGNSTRQQWKAAGTGRKV